MGQDVTSQTSPPGPRARPGTPCPPNPTPASLCSPTGTHQPSLHPLTHLTGQRRLPPVLAAGGTSFWRETGFLPPGAPKKSRQGGRWLHRGGQRSPSQGPAGSALAMLSALSCLPWEALAQAGAQLRLSPPHSPPGAATPTSTEVTFPAGRAPRSCPATTLLSDLRSGGCGGGRRDVLAP